jgi:hypothetical protein
MKRRLFILFVFGVCLIASSSRRLIASSPYVDDSYYWPTVDTTVSAVPIYDRNAQEFIFLEDTTQYPDTIRMRILNK